MTGKKLYNFIAIIITTVCVLLLFPCVSLASNCDTKTNIISYDSSELFDMHNTYYSTLDLFPEINFSQDSITVSEGDGKISIALTSTEPVYSATFVFFNWQEGTATLSSDLSLRYYSAPLYFSTENTYNLNIATIRQDDIYEETETLSVSISDASCATIGTTNTLNITIVDDDAMPEVSISPSTSYATEEDGTGEIRISLSKVSGADTTVYLSTTPGSASSEDYSLSTSEITIPAGELSKTVSYDIVDDNIYEPENESFTISISDAKNATIKNSTASITIVDNDTKPIVTSSPIPSPTNEPTNSSDESSATSETSTETSSTFSSVDTSTPTVTPSDTPTPTVIPSDTPTPTPTPTPTSTPTTTEEVATTTNESTSEASEDTPETSSDSEDSEDSEEAEESEYSYIGIGEIISDSDDDGTSSLITTVVTWTASAAVVSGLVGSSYVMFKKSKRL